MGVWSLYYDSSNALSLLRLFYWPGFFFYHAVRARTHINHTITHTHKHTGRSPGRAFSPTTRCVSAGATCTHNYHTISRITCTHTHTHTHTLTHSQVESGEYGGVYFGNGLANEDLAFML